MQTIFIMDLFQNVVEFLHYSEISDPSTAFHDRAVINVLYTNKPASNQLQKNEY